ncbi:MAG TPA: hypothetical protein VNJ28_01705, partial [Candidatus Limnocylindrales bacterium]|nr:hypothetical protein [Candidatus Limnocylindrales bacterium]
PLLPRPAQIAFRRLVSRVQARSTFPRWPLETALHDLYGLLFRIAAELAGSAIPWIAPWPTPYRWALVLTHDVETETGYRNLPAVRDLERQLGYRSAWNFVARRYRVADERVAELTADGFEVGVHGLYHDGRDLESLATLMRRLPEMRACAERWGATGFRSPATQRDWRLVSALGFDYDSSYPDTDPFEPQPGGCCSWLPYPIGRVVELPITLPQDHTLFAILRTVDAEPWIAKASVLRERGGMALLITHPDYLVGARELGVYRAFLAHFAADDRAWRALPREVAAWWRRRAASEIRRVDGSWRVVGPAAGDAEVCFGPPA